jgi:molybdopterin converting factor small subunit
MELAATDSRLEIHELLPEPDVEWRRMLRFVGLSAADKRAMARTVETLMRRAPEIVVNTYAYLQSVPETAAILGWESGADQEHLEERRRFFTIWTARVLGLDTSDELAYYLFRAGQYHAGHGPRHIHVPPAYVTTSVSIIGAAFAGAMYDAQLPGDVVAPAMAGWNKYLSVHLHLMNLGYQSAIEFARGQFAVAFALYGRLRQVAGQQKYTACAVEGDTLETLLRKFFNYGPQMRADGLRRVWHSHEKEDSSWVEVHQSYTPAPGGWRILLNGRDVAHADGFSARVQSDDVISIFPPGR